MHHELNHKARTPAWRDPLSAGFRAHQHLLLLRLRWHARRTDGAARR